MVGASGEAKCVDKMNHRTRHYSSSLAMMQMWEIRVGGYETPCDTLVVLTLLLGAGLGLGLR